ncbi:tRNA lysidine(34) synthetase TilS [Sphingomonas qilianensis]|uniref:tRNA(Ile)-lysidine synthase n=1 Tax=Sphingomonas qilianensis TaxID=1736690 RepID=A0ABU9XQF8_9SPHN
MARLGADAALALGRAIAPADVIAIAVSGGPDSMALLALASAAWPGQVIAATVDHGLRIAAAEEAAMAGAYCAALGSAPRSVPHTILTPAKPIGSANVQANARTARYALLTDWAIAARATILATAHHADDQAETFLMRAARGSGLAGLAGIRPRRRLNDALTVIRPLLGWRRSDLRALAVGAAVPFVDDPSNTDEHYDRTRFRALLRDAPWLETAQIARTAGHLAKIDADLRALDAWLLETRQQPAKAGDCAIDITGLPREVRRRLTRSAIARVRAARAIIDPAWRDSANIEALLDALEAGKRATQAGVMGSAHGEIWHFTASPPRRTV